MSTALHEQLTSTFRIVVDEAPPVGRKKHVRPSRAQWENAIARLLDLEQERRKVRKTLTTADYQATADGLEVSLNAVEKKMSKVRKGQDPVEVRDRFEFDEAWLPYVAEAPDLYDAWLTLVGEGALYYLDDEGKPIFDEPDDELPRTYSYQTFWRAYRRLDGAVQAGLLGDETDMQPHEAHLLRIVEEVMRLLTIDLYTPKIFAVHPDGTWPDGLYWVSIRDHASRAYLAEHLFFHMPTAAEIIALIGVALRGKTYEDGTFVGGRHREETRILCDNQSILVSELSQEKMLTAGVVLDPVTSYRAWENGQQEKSHADTAAEALGTLPGKTDGPTYQNGELINPAGDGTGPVITTDEVAAILTRHAQSWNVARPSEALDGLSPIHIFQEQQDRITRIPDEIIAGLAMPVIQKNTGGLRTFNKRNDGIAHKHGRVTRWMGEKVGALKGKHKLCVGDFPGARFIAVWDGKTGEFLEFATPHEDVPAETATKIRERKAVNRRTVQEAHREAARRGHVRYGDSMTTPDGPRPKKNNAAKAAAEAKATTGKKRSRTGGDEKARDEARRQSLADSPTASADAQEDAA